MRRRTNLTRFRRLALPVSLAVALAGAVATSWQQPALAHTTSGTPTKNDDTVTATDGTSLSVRLMYPENTVQNPMPANGWPIIIYKSGTGTSKCNSIDFMSRWQLMKYGYAVVSITGRGMPNKSLSGYNPYSDDTTSTESACSESADITDSTNDSGGDMAGAKDVQDIKDVITWVSAAGRPFASSVDENNVGFMGHSLDGLLAYHIASDSRVDAVFSSAGNPQFFRESVSGNTTHQPAAMWNLPLATVTADIGMDRHTDPSVLSNLSEWTRDRFLNLTPGSSVNTFMNDRTAYDDDSAIDEVGDITKPFFIAEGFYEQLQGVSWPIGAYNKMRNAGNTSAYLYLGSCNGHGNKCQGANKTNVRDKVHAFFDQYLKGSGTLGGPIFYAIPPTVEFDHYRADDGQWSTDWGLTTSSGGTNGVWPPSSATADIWYLHSNGSSYTLTTSAPGTEQTDNITNPNHGKGTVMKDDFCDVVGYDSANGESKTYDATTTYGVDTKVVGVVADLYMSSNTSRVQVVADLFEVSGGGVESRLTPSPLSYIVPHASYSSGTVHFTFKPGPVGYTIRSGYKLRLKVASNFKGVFAPEAQPGTFTINHSTATPSYIAVVKL